MKSIVYEEITNLEAMALIDRKDTSKLYFVEFYYESSDPYGKNGWTIHCPTPRDLKQTEPILYHSKQLLKSNNLFRKYREVLAEPDILIVNTPYRIYKDHKWVIKKSSYEREFYSHTRKK
ncbi:hypothetical protein A5886_002160 [Enterococcus sp. 8G7_MSG3316]|uniref:Uncharacterized protein n=1 Tax=Candidatus Enterococcus testudinis TaxID=1834191 RepID=A0A242A866_9ENTE|nr:hypothetical protein [Enterococcus sp. 8G7_MSG3316]OTN77080.1 hypothetical protein A5886_002160 [Enterococcus sp. 8G7_MSG3316]